MINLQKYIAALSLLIMPIPALAYIGPGAGLSAIGALIALAAAIFFTFFGFVWYPLKRLFRNNKSEEPSDDPQPDEIVPGTDTTE